MNVINEKLNSLSLGIEAFCHNKFACRKLDSGNEKTIDYYLGYGKIGNKWGMIVRAETTVNTEWHAGHPTDWKTVNVQHDFLLSAPRQIRVQAIDSIPGLVEVLESKADELENTVAKAEEIAQKL